LPDPMLEITREGAAVTVAVVHAPKLDAGNVRAFKQQLKELLIPEGTLLLDLTEVDFMDSAGLGALMSALRQVTTQGGGLALCNLSASVRYVVEIVRMHKIVDVYNDQGEALRALSN
jgi:anti-sigma B factor antagonist